MTTKLVTVLFFAGMFLVACNQKPAATVAKESGDDKLPLELTAIQVGDGWGYEIDVDNKPFIKQKVIPTIQGFQSFKTKEDALKIGTLTMEKMKQGTKLPSISIEELREAHIAMDETKVN